MQRLFRNYSRTHRCRANAMTEICRVIAGYSLTVLETIWLGCLWGWYYFRLLLFGLSRIPYAAIARTCTTVASRLVTIGYRSTLVATKKVARSSLFDALRLIVAGLFFVSAILFMIVGSSLYGWVMGFGLGLALLMLASFFA